MVRGSSGQILLLNFGIVKKDVMQSGMPNELNFPFLERLQLRKTMCLSAKEVPDPPLNFIDDKRRKKG